MDERQKLILDVFADWSISCHEEYRERYDNCEHKKHIKELTEKAKNAFLKKGEYQVFQDYETEYYEAIYQYLLHGLHIGESIYYIKRDSIDRFQNKWSSAERIISQSENTHYCIESMMDDLDTSSLIHKILDEYGDEVRLIELPDFKEAVSQFKSHEYERRYGKKITFEKAGRYFSENIFRKMTKPLGRPKRWSNLDTVRAYQFSRLVELINDNLDKENIAKTNISEVCEFTFGQNKVANRHPRYDEIQWALREYFQIKNSTVRAFLNSVSRGKAARREMDF